MDIRSSNFAVTPLYPSAQSDHSSPNFDFFVSPGAKVTIGFTLHNKINKGISVTMTPQNASTTPSGEINYSPDPQQSIDSTLARSGMALTTLGARQAKIQIPAKSDVTVKQTLTVPNQPFNGVVLGGYQFSSPSDQSKAPKSKGIHFVNLVAYNAGVMLVIGKSESVRPDLRLNRVAPTMYNGSPEVIFNLQNTKPMYIQNKSLSVQAKMTFKGSKKAVNSLSQNMSFAPNSNVDIPLTFTGKSLPSGQFTLTVDASTSQQHWHFVRHFAISADTARKLNAQNVTVHHNYLWVWILIGVLLSILIVVLVVVLYRHAIHRGQMEARARINGGNGTAAKRHRGKK